jgi:hypothetical protein
MYFIIIIILFIYFKFIILVGIVHTRRNPPKCNKCICNYIQLIVICN